MRKIVVSRKGDNVGSLSERLWRKAKNKCKGCPHTRYKKEAKHE